MARALASTVLFILFPFTLFAQPDTVKIGLFITDLYDLNLSEKRFSADFWLWFNYADSTLAPMETIELTKARELDKRLDFVEEKGGVQWATQKISAIFKADWNVQNFPFDVQVVTIDVEESDRDVGSLVYEVDTANTKYFSEISIKNWEIVDFGVRNSAVVYPTDYGDPTLDGESTYTQATVYFELKRKSQGLFFTLFTGIYVAFFISVLVFFIDPVDVDPRFGLSVGGLFAAVGNKYIVDSILPQSTSFTLVDKIHVMTYIFLLLCIVLSVISLRLWKNKKMVQSRRLDRVSFIVLTLLYIVLNLVFIF
ncbi:MAG: hypothetical protein AB8H12_05215 [Lewinella sp.]